jgi:hypothetical protein
MKRTGENRSTRGKNCPSATLSTTNPTWTGTQLTLETFFKNGDLLFKPRTLESTQSLDPQDLIVF